MAAPGSRGPTAPIVAVSRSIVIVAALAVVGFAYSVGHEQDVIPGVAVGVWDNPRIALAVIVLAPLTLGLLLSLMSRFATVVSAMVVLCCALLESTAAVVNSLTEESAQLVFRPEKLPFLKSYCGRVGYCLEPNTRGTTIGMNGAEVIYHMTVTTDELGQRRSVAPPSGQPSQRKKFIAFFGDSYTFGWAVSDEETLPWRVGDLACAYRPYNFGVAGYGTSGMMAQVQQDGFARLIAEDEGIFVYVYNDSQPRRNLGSDVTLMWGKNLPAYRIDAGRVVFDGPLWTSRPMQNMFSVLRDRLSVASALQLHVPVGVGEEGYRLTAALIDESAYATKRAYPHSIFYVLLFPGTNTGMRVVEYLANKDVKVLDMVRAFPATAPEMFVPIDRHPNGKAYAILASRLVHDLGIGCSAGAP